MMSSAARVVNSWREDEEDGHRIEGGHKTIRTEEDEL